MRYNINYDVLKKLNPESAKFTVYSLVVKHLLPNCDSELVANNIIKFGFVINHKNSIDGVKLFLIKKEANRILKMVELKRTGKSKRITLNSFTTIENGNVVLLPKGNIIDLINAKFINRYPKQEKNIVIQAINDFYYGTRSESANLGSYKFYYKTYRDIVTRIEKNLKIKLK